MKSFSLVNLLIFIAGLLGGYFLYPQEIHHFLDFNPSQSARTIPDYNKITLKNCAPRDEKHGENWLGNDFEEALAKNFATVSQVFQQEKIDDDSGINIYMRGYFQWSPPFPNHKRINLAYVFYPLFFSHYDAAKISQRDRITTTDNGYLQVFFDEMQFYDAIAVASETYAKKMKDAGFKAYYVPQFTNPNRFYPEYDENIKSEILFIGSRPQFRRAPMIVYHHQLPITIYGPESDGLAKAEYIDNNELHKYYSSAKIVLNDTRADMRQHGFINNRLFDVTASGGFLISDYMPEIEKNYGDCVPMWKTEEELVKLVKYYLAPEHKAERLAKAKCAREITLKNFTADIAVQKFVRIIDDIKRKKGIK